MIDRRNVLRTGMAAPFGLLAFAGHEIDAASVAAPPPPYTLSINIEIMFNTGRGNPPIPRADRIRAVAANGFKAYSFWNASPDERKAMIQAQQQTGLKCVSLVGTGTAGGTTGFTKPGAHEALLTEIKERVEIAKEFGTQPDLISFVGIIQPDVPWDAQRSQIVEGLKRAGDIAAAAGVTIALEPLSVGANQPRRALDRAADAFPVIKEVNHPNVKICFDLYHLQRTEGNLVVNLRSGVQDKLIKLVQVGDNPGRLEPGTGEINYPFIFKELRRLNWTGYVDTEHGSSGTAEHAMNVVRKMAEEN
jgi:hydroxypyruvate isomerase